MTEYLRIFDDYARKARIFPGLLTIFPGLLILLAWFPALLTSNWGASLLTIAVSCGLLYALSVFTRTLGKRAEQRLLKRWGGWPTTISLRYQSEALNPTTRARYISALARLVPSLKFPTEAEENCDPKSADEVYASAVDWLKEKTRDRNYDLLRKESADYGFRRNLRGMRPIGLVACLMAFTISVGALIAADDELLLAIKQGALYDVLLALAKVSPAILGATALNLFGAAMWLFIVHDEWVREAGDQYARALLATCDTL